MQLLGLWVVLLAIVVWFSVATFGWRYVLVHCYVWEIDTIQSLVMCLAGYREVQMLSSYSLQVGVRQCMQVSIPMKCRWACPQTGFNVKNRTQSLVCHCINVHCCGC
jgi:hypothetical protein